MSEADTARLFALALVAASDACGAGLNAKYPYAFRRPGTAIRAGDTGNPAAIRDPNWLPLLATPNHPEYPAAHTFFSGAILAAMAHFFGTDEISFTIPNSLPDQIPAARQYARF